MTRAGISANLASHGNLFVDIANDRTGIGSVVPDQNLHVAGTAGFHADVTFTGDLVRISSTIFFFNSYLSALRLIIVLLWLISLLTQKCFREGVFIDTSLILN